MNDRQAQLARGWWHETVLLVVLVVMLGVAGWLVPDFLNLRNQLYLSRHLWEFALLAIGMTLIIITGGIDLSVGSAMGLCAVAFGIAFQMSGSTVVASILCLCVGLVGGAVNGALIAGFKVHPLIVTLATYAVFRGMAEGISQGASYSGFGDRFASIARAAPGQVPYPAFLFGSIALAVAIFLRATPTGRILYAMGHNEQAARFSGTPVDRIKFGIYAFSGLLAGLATILYVARFDTAKADAGRGFELDVITAVVVGGTSIFGGRGHILGTLLGLILIHETRLFVSRYWGIEELKPIVVGSLLILAVLVAHNLSRGGRLRRGGPAVR